MASELCMATLAFIVIEKLSSGHVTAVNAIGKVARFQMVRGLLRVSVVPMALFLIWLVHSVSVMSVALPLSACAVALGDVYLARTRAGMSVKYWIKRVVVPLLVVALVTALIAIPVGHCFGNPWIRLLVTSLATFIAMMLLSWFLLFDLVERDYILKIFKRMKF